MVLCFDLLQHQQQAMYGYPFLFAFWDAADKLLCKDEWSALCNVCHLKHAQNITPSA